MTFSSDIWIFLFCFVQKTFEWVSCCCCWFTFYMLAPYCLLDGGDVCVCMVLTELHRSKFILGWYARATDDGFPEQKWRNLWIEVFQWISSRIGTTCNVLPMARGASWIFLGKMTGEIKGNNCIDEQRIDLANVSYHSYCSLVYCSNALNSTTYFTNSIYGINSKWNSTTINLFCIIIKRHIVRCSYRYTTLFTFLLKKYTHTQRWQNKCLKNWLQIHRFSFEAWKPCNMIRFVFTHSQYSIQFRKIGNAIHSPSKHGEFDQI